MTKINYKKGITRLEGIIIGIVILIIIILGLGYNMGYGKVAYYRTFGNQSVPYQTGSSVSGNSYTYLPGSTTSSSTTYYYPGSTTTTVVPPAGTPTQPPSQCLPSDIAMNDVVSAENNGQTITKVTVQQTLASLQAYCQNGKLLSGTTGREIKFYHMKGCWGAISSEEEAILEAQQAELTQLKAHYTVVEMTCNPNGDYIL